MGKVFPVFKLIEDSPLLGREFVKQIMKAPCLQEQWVVMPFGDLFYQTLDLLVMEKRKASVCLPAEF